MINALHFNSFPVYKSLFAAEVSWMMNSKNVFYIYSSKMATTDKNGCRITILWSSLGLLSILFHSARHVQFSVSNTYWQFLYSSFLNNADDASFEFYCLIIPALKNRILHNIMQSDAAAQSIIYFQYLTLFLFFFTSLLTAVDDTSFNSLVHEFPPSIARKRK